MTSMPTPNHHISVHAQTRRFHRFEVGLPALAAMTVGSIAAFVWLPRWVVGGVTRDQGGLVTTTTNTFIDTWSHKNRPFSPQLDRLIVTWRDYHLLKALCAAIVVTLCFVIAGRLWGSALDRKPAIPRSTKSDTSSHARLKEALRRGAPIVTLRTLSIASVAMGLFALLLVLANMQGVISPLASLVSLLPIGAGPDELGTTIHEINAALTHAEVGGTPLPSALQTILDDFARYHLAMAIMSGILTIVACCLAVSLWRHRLADDAIIQSRAPRRAMALTCAAFAMLMALLSFANTTVAIDSLPALQAFFSV